MADLVALANAAIVVINVYYLSRLLRDRAAAAYFEVVEIDPSTPFATPACGR